jgi:hypothetical protein
MKRTTSAKAIKQLAALQQDNGGLTRDRRRLIDRNSELVQRAVAAEQDARWERLKREVSR